MKTIILLLLAAIVISLASGLFFLTKDKGEGNNSPKLLRALKIRVALSILLIAFLVASFYFGWVPMPEVTAPSDAASGP